MTFLTDFFSQTAPFGASGNPPSGIVATGLFSLLLICVGIAVDIGLVWHWIKRPVHLPELAERLASRSLPGPLALIFLGSVVGFYVLASWSCLVLFPDGEMGPKTVIFQTVFFHFPVLGVLGLLFRISRLSWRERFGLHGRRVPARLGLSILFYLAALPLLWFYNELYQRFLDHLGYEFSLQDIAQILRVPAPWPIRTSLFLIILIVAPIFEEIVFRGILLPFLVSRMGLLKGIALVSLLFAGLHGHLPSLLPLFLLSALLSLAYARTQSLWVPIGMHVLFNGVTVILLLWTS